MAVSSKLNPFARPFFSSNPQRHLLQPQSLPMAMCHAVASPPPPPFPFVTTIYPCAAPFPAPAPHCPLPLPAPAAHPHRPPPPTFLRKRVQFLPAVLHGRPPHKLMAPRTAVHAQADDEKVQARAQAAAMARAAADVTAAPQEPPAPPAAARRPRRAVVLAAAHSARLRHQKAQNARSKNHVARRAATPATRSGTTARPPPPEYVRPRRLQTSDTTVMVRNIPNKLTFREMVRFLDEHCAHMNQERGARLAYDFLYVPIDFRMSSGCRSSNFGYAFVNLTTPRAARRMQRSLSGFHWNLFGSQKVIETCRANIQGKHALEQRLGRINFDCHTDEFLPAVFSPPRDGAGDAKPPRRIGRRAPHQPAYAPHHAVKPSS